MSNDNKVTSWTGYKTDISKTFKIAYYQSYDSSSTFNAPPTLNVVIKVGEINYDTFLSVDEMYLLQDELDKILALERASRHNF